MSTTFRTNEHGIEVRMTKIEAKTKTTVLHEQFEPVSGTWVCFRRDVIRHNVLPFRMPVFNVVEDQFSLS